MSGHGGVLVQLRALLAQEERRPNERLPPERVLCTLIGTSRGELRKALSELEAKGLIWRHIGKGTFVGRSPLAERFDLDRAANRSNPREVMRARILLEPVIAGEAALHGKPALVTEMYDCIRESVRARTWRQYESWNNQLHRLIAAATDNEVLSALYDVLAGIRRAVVWGRLRREAHRPPPDHHSFAEHEAIVAAIAKRDRASASASMLTHMRSVERCLFFETIPPGERATGPKQAQWKEVRP